jgi:hypothetical protein
MTPFSPRLDILPDAQRALWPELIATPPEFTLYGGTAIALQLGHRQSVDFDFFSARRFNGPDLLRDVPFLKDAVVVKSLADTLTVRINRGGPVALSFFSLPRMGAVEPPLVARDHGLKIAPLIDLAGFKAVVVQQRAELKDYVDIDAIIGAGVSLASALAAAFIVQGSRFNPQLTLKALTYFEDGNVAALDARTRRRLQEAVRSVDPRRLPDLAFLRRYDERGDA